MRTLEEIIRQYVRFKRTNNRGWHECVHTGCDHGRKGPRAAFLFPGGGGLSFNCFNCGTKIKFDPNESNSFPKNLKKILKDFGIPDSEWKPIELQLFVADKKEREEQEKEVRKIVPEVIKLPASFYLLKDAEPSDKWAEVARAYLESRSIDLNSVPFMLSSRRDKWSKRVIIPMYRNNELIFYTGRDLTGKAQKKYETPMVEKDKVIFGFDELFKHTDKPLYVVEGVMDALPLPDFAAILGNEITDAQIEWFNKSNREKVYIPDRIKGKRAAYKALDLGWSISTPEISDCKDVNDAVVDFGKLYVLRSLVDNTGKGELAKLKVGLYCES